MRNQLFHANLFPDLSKVTLRRVFKTDQGWVMEAAGEIIAMVGRALGGRPGQRLMSRLGMPLSADTLIRRVKKAARRSALPHPIRVRQNRFTCNRQKDRDAAISESVREKFAAYRPTTPIP